MDRMAGVMEKRLRESYSDYEVQASLHTIKVLSLIKQSLIHPLVYVPLQLAFWMCHRSS